MLNQSLKIYFEKRVKEKSEKVRMKKSWNERISGYEEEEEDQDVIEKIYIVSIVQLRMSCSPVKIFIILLVF